MLWSDDPAGFGDSYEKQNLEDIMRPATITLEQEQRQRIIRRLLRETVGREEILADIRDTIRSLLTHADLMLGSIRRDYIEIGSNPVLRDRSRMQVEEFHMSALAITSSLRQSIRALGDGAEERLLFNQVARTEELIDRVYALCKELVMSAGDLLVG